MNEMVVNASDVERLLAMVKGVLALHHVPYLIWQAVPCPTY
jgi:hypothetical protein